MKEREGEAEMGSEGGSDMLIYLILLRYTSII